MDKKSSVSVLDLLLRPELPDVRRELPEKRVEVKRLSRLAGEPVVFRLKALTYDQTRRVQDKPRGNRQCRPFYWAAWSRTGRTRACWPRGALRPPSTPSNPS